MSEYHRFVTFLGDTGAPSTIRILIPYQYISSYNSNILPSYDFLLHTNKDYYNDLSILQYQRSATIEQYNTIKYIKDNINNIKIFYEVDDLITNIPNSNRSHKYYENNKSHVISILKTVDIIVTSTHELAKHLSKYNKRVKVIKNRLSKPLYYHNKSIVEHQKPKILWTGSDSHRNDFDPILIDFIKKTANIYDWVFYGYLPYQLEHNNITHIKWNRNYYEYVHDLKQINPNLAIAPLEINDFNKCKSNLKALEYTVLGIPGVYTEITPYRGMTMTAKNINKFIDQIQTLANDPDLANETYQKDYNNLKNDLYWDNEYVKKYLDIYLGK